MAGVKKIKVREVEKLGALQCTPREASAFLGVRVNTFRKLLRVNPKMADAWERGQQMGLIGLRRKQMRLAGGNASMAIFLGKNYLRQREINIHEIGGPDGAPIELDLTKISQTERDELREILSRASRSNESSSGTG